MPLHQAPNFGADVGFGSLGQEERENPQGSLVYGMIDPERPEYGFWGVKYQKVGPGEDDSSFPFAVRGGMFYHAALPNGSYRLTEFSTGTPTLNITHHIGRQGGRKARIRIEEPGIHFVGAFKAVSAEEAVPSAAAEEPENKFVLVPVQGERRRKIRIHFLKALHELAEGTAWAPRIAKRLETLEGEGAQG